MLLIAMCSLLAVPSVALAAGKGCEVLHDAADRADCEVRAQARDAARAEVQRALGSDSTATQRQQRGSSGPKWDAAIAEASRPDFQQILTTRPIAAAGGLIWFVLVVRHRWRARRVTHTG